MAKAHTLKEARIAAETTSLHSSFLQSTHPREDQLTAVILHGAGQSDSARHAGLAQLFAEKGISVASLDFIGHGKTGGAVADSSLQARHDHAVATIHHWTKPHTPLIVCGFSMSGHIALRLSDSLGARVQSLGLFCPATYAREAETLQFGSAFTETIRKADSWRSSLGLEAARKFKGRAKIILGANDSVIPWEVTSEMLRSLRENTASTQLSLLGDVDHQLASWLSHNQDFSRATIDYLAGEA